MGWIRGKLQDRKDRDAERRTRTPERNQSSANGRQEFGTPVHMDSLNERQRDVTSSGTGTDAAAQPQNVPGATVVTPAPIANTTGNPSPMPPQAQEQTTAEPNQTSSAPAPTEIVDTAQTSVPSDPAVHERVDAVMGGK
jgi:cell division septation protein DedD